MKEKKIQKSALKLGIKLLAILLILIFVNLNGYSQTILGSISPTVGGPVKSNTTVTFTCSFSSDNQDFKTVFFDGSSTNVTYSAVTSPTSFVVSTYGVFNFSIKPTTEISNGIINLYFHASGNYTVTSVLSVQIKVDNTAPSVPVINTPTATYQSVDVNWNASTDVNSAFGITYNVSLLNSSNSVIQSESTTSTSTSFTNLTSCYNSYKIQITATDRAGNTSSASTTTFNTPGAPFDISLNVTKNTLNGNLFQSGGIWFVQPGTDFCVWITNSVNTITYTSSHSSGVNEVYGGNNFRAYSPVTAGSSNQITISGNRCNVTNSTTIDVFVQYNSAVPTPNIGGYYTPHFAGTAHTYYIQNQETIDAADGYEWDVYDSNNNLIYTEYNTTSIYLYIARSGNYTIKAKAWSNGYRYESEWGVRNITVLN